MWKVRTSGILPTSLDSTGSVKADRVTWGGLVSFGEGRGCLLKRDGDCPLSPHPSCPRPAHVGDTDEILPAGVIGTD